MRQAIYKIIERINKVFLYIVAFLVFGTVASAFADVMSRILFDKSIFWASQVATWMMLTVTFFGAGMVLWEREHINMDFIPAMIKGKPKKILDIINHIAVLIFVCLVLIAGASYTWLLFINNTTRAVGKYTVPYWPIIFIAATLGPALLLFFSVVMLWRVIHEPPVEMNQTNAASDPEEGGE